MFLFLHKRGLNRAVTRPDLLFKRITGPRVKRRCEASPDNRSFVLFCFAFKKGPIQGKLGEESQEDVWSSG